MTSEISQPKIKFRWLLILFFSIGLLLRMIFILGKPQIPVMWDARIYSSAALGIIEYIGEGGKFGHPKQVPPEDSISQKMKFEFSVAEHISGEQIEWLYYSKPIMAQAQDNIFISGPVYPILLAVILWQDIFPDFNLGRFINAVFDCLSIVLLMLIAGRLFGRREALLAGVIYIFYTPLILLCGMISPDPVTILLILLALLMLLKWHDKKNSRNLIWVGVILGVLVLTRPTASLLFIPFLGGFIYDNRMRLKNIAPAIIKSASIFVLIILPWILFASFYYNRLTIRDPQYSEANLRSSSLTRYEGYDLDWAEKDFWSYDISSHISQDLPAYAELMVKKFVRLWVQPYNDFQQSFLMPGIGEKVYHFLIILPGLFGIFLFIIEKKRGLIYLAVIPIYYTLVHMFFHSLARYNLAAMPLMIVAASAVWIKIYDYFHEMILTKEKARLLLEWSLFVIGFITLFLLPYNFLVQIIGNSFGVWLMIMIRLLLLGLLLVYLIKRLEYRIPRNLIIRFISIPAIILAVVFIVINIAPESWAEWNCPLNNKNAVAGVRIYIPKNIRLKPEEVARIGIDLTGSRDASNRLLVSVNQEMAGLTIGRPPLSSFYYNKMTYKVYERLIGFTPEEMRVWSFLPLSPQKFNELADRDGFISVALASADATDDNRNVITLYGNMIFGEKDSLLIPDLSHSSIERYVEKGDPRPWVKYPLSSDSAVSYFIPDVTGNLVLFDNLSPTWGRQTGRYRIIIEIKKKDGTSYYL